jgi:hypothetical protein
MIRVQLKPLAWACLGFLSVGTLAQDRPMIWNLYRLASGLVDLPPAPSSAADVYYRTSHVWLTPDATAPKGNTRTPSKLNYCVFPAIAMKPRPGGTTAWGTPFELALVNAAGAPAAPTFKPVAVPAGIPSPIFQLLEPTPVWCATVPSAGGLPEIYLQVGTKRVRVEFINSPSLPVGPTPTPTRSPTGAASSPR